MSFHIFHILLVVIALALNNVSATLCYSCSSIMDGRCGGVFSLPPASAQECTGSCAKYTATRQSTNGPVEEISRQCVPQKADGCQHSQFLGSDVCGCHCNSDYCNGGLHVSPSVVVLVMCIVRCILSV